MSNPFDTFARSVVTVYAQGGGTDSFGRPIGGGVKGVVACEVEKGGSMRRDDNGDEFVPMTTIYPTSDLAFEIERGDKIAFGDTSATATPPSGSELVRTVDKSDEDYFGWGKAVVVYTG